MAVMMNYSISQMASLLILDNISIVMLTDKNMYF